MNNANKLPIAPIPGGDYHWFQNEAGNWNCDNVLMFAEMPEKGIDAEWIMAAVARSKHRLAESQYMSPLHIQHTDKDSNPTPQHAGLYWLSGAESIQYEGKTVMACKANFRNVTQYVYEQIRDGQMPYASVEVHNIKIHEIDSLALMAGVVPRFRLPLIRVASEHRLVASAAANESERGFFLTQPFGGKPMEPEVKKDPPESTPEPAKEPEKPAEEPESGATETELKILESLATLNTNMTKLIEVLAPKTEQPAVPPAGVPAEQPMQASALNAAIKSAVDPLMEKVNKLTGDNAERDLMASADKSLEGFLLTDEDNKRLHQSAKFGKNYLEMQVESLKAHAQKVPGSTPSESLSTPTDDVDVLKCAAIVGDEPEVKSMLRAKADEYDDFVANGVLAAARPHQIDKDGKDLRRAQYIERETKLAIGA